MAVAPPSLAMNAEDDAPEIAAHQRRRSSQNTEPVFRLIAKAEDKRVAKRKIIDFLKRKGIDEDQIIESYKTFYDREGLYEITFHNRPLGFSVISDTRAKNAIVSTIHTKTNRKLGMELASRLYEINGKRVDGLKHSEILNICGPAATMPLVVVFRRPAKKTTRLAKVTGEPTWIREEANKPENEEESSSDDEGYHSYDSDDDESHLATYLQRKRASSLRRKQDSAVAKAVAAEAAVAAAEAGAASGGESQTRTTRNESGAERTELALPGSSRNSLSISHSHTFRMNEMQQWGEGELEEQRTDMVKELARLLLENGTTSTTNVLDEDEISHQLSSRSATTLQAISRGTTPRAEASFGFGFSDDIAELNAEIDIAEGDVDPEIFEYLQELISDGATGMGGGMEIPETPLETRQVWSEFESEELDAMETMRSGSTFMKYGRYGKPKFRKFQLSSDNSHLIWFSEKKSLAQTQIPIALIDEIRIGRDSDVTTRTSNADLTETSFTIVYRREASDDAVQRQLTVSAQNMSEAYIWAQGLKILADAARRGEQLETLRLRAPSSPDGNHEEKKDVDPSLQNLDPSVAAANAHGHHSHARHGSVVIAMDEMRRNSIMKRFNRAGGGTGAPAETNRSIEKSLNRCSTNMKKIVKFLTNEDTFKAVEASGQYEGIRATLEDLDTRYKRALAMHETGDESKRSAIKADIFTMNAELDALKQKLTAVSRTPHRL